jgi:adenosylcobyric acid synthase
MFAGTGSEVGKSVIAAAFCRIFRQDGYRPAPFKAQNMSLNSYATPEGLEIGRAQAMQAEAAGIPCHSDMNPLLLKPSGPNLSQVVLNGRPSGTQGAYEYFRKEGRDELRQEVNAAFDRLAARYNPIVMEGAGSLAEINLREIDLVNMPMAIHAGARVIIVADIDRGGVFAAVYGSIMLLRPEERAHIGGILINKFRGDMRLFESGVRMLEELCQVPVVGVVPYFSDIQLEAEDSVALERKPSRAGQGKINVAVVALSHLSNFTDFDALERDPRVHLYYTRQAAEIAKADIILLPGSKNTLSDLSELQRNGLDRTIIKAYQAGRSVAGICGGYQMMGQEISDPEQVEGTIGKLSGLGLLPVSTRIESRKLTRQTNFTFLPTAAPCRGYEIHMGETVAIDRRRPSPLNRLPDGSGEGYLLNRQCFGTYMHGILDNPAVINYLLETPAGHVSAGTPCDHTTFKEEQYDKLAEHVRRHVDMTRIYQLINKN